MDMSIAAMSVVSSQQQAAQDFGVGVLRMAIAASTQGTEELLGEMTGSLDPNLGTNIDVQA